VLKDYFANLSARLSGRSMYTRACHPNSLHLNKLGLGGMGNPQVAKDTSCNCDVSSLSLLPGLT
jgi:hypothetical protein